MEFVNVTNLCSCLVTIKVQNKKVLLRESKRRTAPCVASTPSVVLTGGWEVPHPRTGWGRGVPHPCPGEAGYPLPPSGPGQVIPPHLDLAGVPPPTHGQTDRWMYRHVSKHYFPVVLRTRAVIKTTLNLSLNLAQLS